MNELAMRPWTVEAFFKWQASQEARYELVGGFPLQMMTGASNRHDDIVVNISGELRSRLRGSGCRPFSADGSIETFPGQIRRPDIGVDCGPRDPKEYKATHPVVVFEVLSRSTRNFDRFRKIDEYKAVESIRHIVFVEPDRPRILLWSRDRAGIWQEEALEGIDAALALPAIGISVPFSEIYDGVEFSEGV